jgi:signal transduction histidine kinase
MRRLALVCAIVLPLVLGHLAGAAHAQDERPQRVLILSTGTRLAPGFVLAEQPILKALRSLPAGTIELLAENLDIIRSPEDRSRQMLTDYLGAKYRQHPPDLVILIFVGHLQVALEALQALFPDTAIIAAGFTEAPLRPEQFGPMVGGLVQRIDAHATLDLMLRLHPDVKRIVVIGGTALPDHLLRERVRVASRSFERRVAIDFWDNVTIEQVHQAVPNMPPGSVILFSEMFQDAAGQPFVSSEVGRWIGHWANVPVHVLSDPSIGTGAVGGSLASAEGFAETAADIALRVLNGTPIGAFPFEIRSRTVPMFDWRALQRWGINERALPPGSVVRFKPPSLWAQYRWYFVGALLLILLQSATIVALIAQRRRRRRAEVEALRQRAELAHVGRISLMGELAASLAHELSQPLTAIFGNASAGLQALQQGQYDAAELHDILDDVVKDQTRAAEVVRRMRRMVKKETELEFVAVDVGEVVREVVALVRNEAAHEQVEIAVDIEPGLPFAEGDRVQLQQVLLNLLLNAVEAVKGLPHRARTVALHARRRDGVIEVAVRDRGRGIAADDVEQVFSPFYTTKREGLGMGLSICRSIIEAHGGRLWAENNAEGGATFYFTLPVQAD